MIKILVCDGDGTLLLPSPSKEILQLLQKLGQLNIKLVVATNSTHAITEAKFKKSGLPMPSLIASTDIVGSRKPSADFIKYISDKTGVQPNEMIYLGDDDKTDIFCAANAHVLPFASHYSLAGQPKYGLPVNNPLELMRYLETYGIQNPPFFGWNLLLPQQSVEVYALIGEHSRIGLTTYLKQFLKSKQDFTVGPKKNPFGTILFHYFLSQSYLSGIIQGIDLVAVYPGHEKGSQNQILSDYSSILPKILKKNKFLPDLLMRHTTAPPSHVVSGANRDIYQQLSTIQLNETYRKRVEGKRVLILDDFTTSGNGMETARVMLLNGGASSVVGLAFAKFRYDHHVLTVNGAWNPFEPFTLDRKLISTNSVNGKFNPAADDHFANVIWKSALT